LLKKIFLIVVVVLDEASPKIGKKNFKLGSNSTKLPQNIFQKYKKNIFNTKA
jgi:hypothetical protein